MPPVIKPSAKPKNNLGSYAFLLILLLSLLFLRSFAPDYVHFSNDGPLGAQMAEYGRPPEAFKGAWYDLTWIGTSAASLPIGAVSLLNWILGPVGFAKFLAPIALIIMGLCAWTFLKRLNLSPTACVLGGLAAALNGCFLGTACWGVAGQVIGFGFDYLALAMVVSNTKETPRWLRWVRLILAGFAVGMSVIDGADNGAIFSLFVAAFVFYKSVIEENGVPFIKNAARGIGRVAIIALFAALLATQNISSLISTAIEGVGGAKQDVQTKEKQWNWATQWSIPKIETLGLFMPGIFGYRMDTPNNMLPALQNTYEGGNYWGMIGSDPSWQRYFENGKEGPPPQGFPRFSGGGNYGGVFVFFIAIWAVTQSLRRDSVFSLTQRRFIWFWAAAMLIALPLAWGRFGPGGFPYRALYSLPYFSTIRNPCKFMSPFNWALIVLFGYGIHGLTRRYFDVLSNRAQSPMSGLKSWWKTAHGFDRKWIIGCLAAIGVSFVGWLIYANCKSQLVAYMQLVQVQGDLEKVASFSIRQVGWFILYLVLGTSALAFTFSGAFAGRRSKIGAIVFGFILLADLGRADLPFIIHWNYKQKYEVGTLNPIVSFLAEKPYEQRVVHWPPQTMSFFSAPPNMALFGDVYRIEWSQQFFPYYNILQLDIIQNPRPTEDFMAFEEALSPHQNDQMYLLRRRWELTSTRYLLGPMVTRMPVDRDASGNLVYRNFGTLEFLNNGLDSGRGRFRILKQFEIVPKPGVVETRTLEQLTATDTPDERYTLSEFPKGRYALFDFTGALPHVDLFSHWEVITNDDAALETLAARDFSPQETVLVHKQLPTPSGPINQPAGDVDFVSYHPADIVLKAHAQTNCVLLLSDHYDPQWRVLVDGKPAELLRCNYIMRGVYLPPGEHQVEFLFRVSMLPAYVTLAAMVFGILLSGVMIYSEHQAEPRQVSEETSHIRGNNAKNRAIK